MSPVALQFENSVIVKQYLSDLLHRLSIINFFDMHNLLNAALLRRRGNEERNTKSGSRQQFEFEAVHRVLRNLEQLKNKN